MPYPSASGSFTEGVFIPHTSQEDVDSGLPDWTLGEDDLPPAEPTEEYFEEDDVEDNGGEDNGNEEDSEYEESGDEDIDDERSGDDGYDADDEDNNNSEDDGDNGGCAIVDEVDSILIDEARTPLIISGPAEVSTDLYYEVDKIIPKLKKGEVHQGQVKAEDRDRLEASGDYTVDEKHKTVTLTEAGMAECEQMLAHRMETGGLYDPGNMPLLHHIQQALRAHVHYHRDVEYMIKDGQVVIVDPAPAAFGN